MEFFFDLFDQFVAWATAGGSTYVWLSISAVLALTGVGLPTPEDIWLMLAGFLTYKSGFLGRAPTPDDVVIWDYAATLFFCAGSNMIGDAGCWWLGKRFGLPLRARIRFFRHILTNKRLRRVDRWFNRFGGATIFFGRLVAGVRFVVFFTAGVTRMRLRTFVMWDALGCMVSIPLWLYLGRLGAGLYETEHYQEFRKMAKDTGLWVLAGGVLLVLLFFTYVKVFVKKRHEDEDDDHSGESSKSEMVQALLAAEKAARRDAQTSIQ